MTSLKSGTGKTAFIPKLGFALLLIGAGLSLGGLWAVPAVHAESRPDAIAADGGRYYGPLVAGKRQGRGVIEWDNGARYEGGFDQGLYAGQGKYRSSSGFTYEGSYRHGAMDGRGRYAMPDGAVYVGEFRNDSFNGLGRYEMPGAYVYEGMFKNGVFEGKGKLTNADETYQGDFRQGQYWGVGQQKYQDGRSYQGEFVRNQYQGKGRYESADGQIYEGQFKQGQLTGLGSYVRRDGSRYEGEFLKWQPQGKGRYIDAKGNVYEGMFTEGELNGTGRMTGRDGSRYEGEFRNWKFHGKGIYRYASGDVYQGNFAYGLFEGEGTYTYAKPKKDGRTKDSGTWHYGSLEDKEAEQQTRRNVEAALYQQRALLDRALAALAPSDHGKINLYLLAVAGDGSQEVFRRETEFVRNQFDRDFATRGRSLILANSRTSVTTLPMATQTSIRESIKALAGRMDRDKDILFLYLTSHGSKDHQFVLDQNGMNLRNLQAKELGSLLKESGIRWKVVVVSACYAGGFIDPIKDEHTLVITAARRDRTSFGCADDNDFTYFGKAFFKEALPRSSSFEDAFGKAKTLVGQWEEADFKEDGKNAAAHHSEPQIYKPRLILDYLQRWRAQRAPARQQAGLPAAAATALAGK